MDTFQVYECCRGGELYHSHHWLLMVRFSMGALCLGQCTRPSLSVPCLTHLLSSLEKLYIPRINLSTLTL